MAQEIPTASLLCISTMTTPSAASAASSAAAICSDAETGWQSASTAPSVSSDIPSLVTATSLSTAPNSPSAVSCSTAAPAGGPSMSSACTVRAAGSA